MSISLSIENIFYEGAPNDSLQHCKDSKNKAILSTVFQMHKANNLLVLLADGEKN